MKLNQFNSSSCKYDKGAVRINKIFTLNEHLSLMQIELNKLFAQLQSTL